MTIYEFIDDACKKKNISRGQLADRIGVPRSTLSMAFKRQTKIPAERLKKIAQVLEVPYQYFLVFNSDFELLLDKNGLEEISQRVGLEEDTIERIILHDRISYTVNWILKSLEFWSIASRLSKMIEDAPCDPVQNYKDWDYNEYLCYRDFANLLKEARHEVEEYILTEEEKQQIEKYEFGDESDEDDD